MISMRLAPTPHERRTAQRILAEMERNGLVSVDEYFATPERRELDQGASSERRPRQRGDAPKSRKPKGT
jgi:hypothetical protein